MRIAEFGVRITECGVRNKECGINFNAELGIRIAESILVPNAEFGMRNQRHTKKYIEIEYGEVDKVERLLNRGMRQISE